MKLFFKSTLSALAVSAVVVLALLNSGCNKNPRTPSSDSIIGTWNLEFYEEEFGGECSIEYTFKEDGEMTTNISCYGDQYSLPMEWYSNGDKLFYLDKDDKTIIEGTDHEWSWVKFKVSGNALDFFEGDEVTVSLTRVK